MGLVGRCSPNQEEELVLKTAHLEQIYKEMSEEYQDNKADSAVAKHAFS